MPNTSRLRSIASAACRWSCGQYQRAPIAIALFAVAAPVIIATSTFAYEASQNRLQRQCLAYLDALAGGDAGKMQILYSLAQAGNTTVKDVAKTVAEQLQLTDANRAYCPIPQ